MDTIKTYNKAPDTPQKLKKYINFSFSPLCVSNPGSKQYNTIT